MVLAALLTLQPTLARLGEELTVANVLPFVASLALMTSAAGLRRGYLLGTAWNQGRDLPWRLAGISAPRRAALLCALWVPLFACLAPTALLLSAWTPVPRRLVVLTAVAASALGLVSAAANTLAERLAPKDRVGARLVAALSGTMLTTGLYRLLLTGDTAHNRLWVVWPMSGALVWVAWRCWTLAIDADGTRDSELDEPSPLPVHGYRPWAQWSTTRVLLWREYYQYRHLPFAAVVQLLPMVALTLALLALLGLRPTLRPETTALVTTPFGGALLGVALITLVGATLTEFRNATATRAWWGWARHQTAQRRLMIGIQAAGSATLLGGVSLLFGVTFLAAQGAPAVAGGLMVGGTAAGMLISAVAAGGSVVIAWLDVAAQPAGRAGHLVGMLAAGGLTSAPFLVARMLPFRTGAVIAWIGALLVSAAVVRLASTVLARGEFALDTTDPFTPDLP
ncbi:hypothetical protein [Gemmatimonas sp.]|uniref:hypothetical protein n=1 Tax=Gemmatimonas sp. TaxID=1962908 RepID=UPI0037C13149